MNSLATSCTQPALDCGLQESLRIECLDGAGIRANLLALQDFVLSQGVTSLAQNPRWLLVLEKALGHVPRLVVARDGEEIAGVLPLGLVRSMLFGRYLVALPYLNTGGVLARNPEAARALVDQAVRLADEMDVRHLELRHETALPHDRLTGVVTNKVHMRLPLPKAQDELWSALKAKVRNQIRKAEKFEFAVCWGGAERLEEFYSVFSQNMRDLGTPVYGRRLFREILATFDKEAELCVLRLENKPVAAALLLHGQQVTEVPSASSLRAYNSSNPNMLMYWHLLCRTIERGQRVFDFGRSSQDSGTFRFKRQWGAQPEPAVWQYYPRRGQVNQMRPESGKYDRLIRIWKRLPLSVTRMLGPSIVRGIP